MKFIAFYLPQFHEIPENNQWWGEGFTEWTNMKKAKPLYPGHNQPRIPLNYNYYDLSKKETLQWQAEIARQYGIHGFCIYHYWFGDKMLLEKPAEILLENKDIDINYCFCWANESWTNAWVSKSNKVLIEQKYGDKEEWKKHFDYFLPFFMDHRYIKENNMPLLVIYRPELIPCLNEMLDYLNSLAKKKGFAGITFAYQQTQFDDIHGDDSRFTYNIEYEPMYALRDLNYRNPIKKFVQKTIDKLNNTVFKNNTITRERVSIKRWDYDKVWKAVINHKPSSDKCIAGAFVDWDNSPRRGNKGYVIENGNPEKFGMYLEKQVENVKKNYHNEYIFIFAWNEWAEGGYLEPDTKNGYRYLEEIKRVNEKYL